MPPPGGRRPCPLRDWIFSTSPPNMSECLPQAEVELATARAQVALRVLRVPQLPPVIEPDRTHGGADPDSGPRGIAHVGVSRVVALWSENPPEGHVLGSLPDIPRVQEHGPPQDPKQRESCLDRAQEEDFSSAHIPVLLAQRVDEQEPASDLV